MIEIINMLTKFGYHDFMICNPAGAYFFSQLTTGEEVMIFTKPNEYTKKNLSVIKSLSIFIEASSQISWFSAAVSVSICFQFDRMLYRVGGWYMVERQKALRYFY
jgi:hypothetical protein